MIFFHKGITHLSIIPKFSKYFESRQLLFKTFFTKQSKIFQIVAKNYLFS